jgi:hypothetical protein
VVTGVVDLQQLFWRAMKVVLRIRPVTNIDYKLSRGKTSGPELCVNLKSDGQTIELIKDPYSSRHFRYSHIFSSSTTQEVVYDYACEEIVQGYLQGYHSSIICYGQTGTGKTYTMFGVMDQWNFPPNQRQNLGMFPQSLCQIFDYLSSCHRQKRAAQLFLSFYEIYLENITDLLLPSSGPSSVSHRTQHSQKKGSSRPTPPSLQIRESVEKGVYVEGLSIFPVNDPQEIYQLLQRAVSLRVTHGLDLNETSSRSHAIIQLTLEQEAISEESPTGSVRREGNERKRILRNVLTFCDLAGSERVHRIGPKNQSLRLREAQNINRSICALGNCIQALAAHSTAAQRRDEDPGAPLPPPHIPYRDSKLTRLLSETLSGNSRVCLISTIGPCSHSYEETLSTLIFSSRSPPPSIPSFTPPPSS